MSLLSSLQNRAMRWIVRQAFGRDPRELAGVLHELNEAVYQQARRIAELEKATAAVLTEVVPFQSTQIAEVQRFQSTQIAEVGRWRRTTERQLRRHDLFFLHVARELRSLRFTQALGLKLLGMRCETCGAEAETPCQQGLPTLHGFVCMRRHDAAITHAIRLAEAFA